MSQQPGFLVFRTKPLPMGEMRGTFVLVEQLIALTRDALVSFAVAGIQNGGHEGLVYWAGREMAGLTFYSSIVVPKADHRQNAVFVNERSFGDASRAARSRGVSLLCQVHSHPGKDARHSDGDDDLITMPFDGMLSIVAPNYGKTLKSIADLQVHQFQDGRWVLCTKESVTEHMKITPSLMDLR